MSDYRALWEKYKNDLKQRWLDRARESEQLYFGLSWDEAHMDDCLRYAWELWRILNRKISIPFCFKAQ